jgi:hypothetical protein
LTFHQLAILSTYLGHLKQVKNDPSDLTIAEKWLHLKKTETLNSKMPTPNTLAYYAKHLVTGA